MKPALFVGVLMVALDAAGYLALGAWGVVTASICGPLVAVAATRGSLPAKHRAPRRTAAERDGTAAFASYRRMSSMIRWTTGNHHYYEAVTRPFFASTAAALLAERRGVDLDVDPETAQRILGPQVWSLVNPGGSRADPQPATREDLTSVVERLEQL